MIAYHFFYIFFRFLLSISNNFNDFIKWATDEVATWAPPKLNQSVAFVVKFSLGKKV